MTDIRQIIEGLINNERQLAKRVRKLEVMERGAGDTYITQDGGGISNKILLFDSSNYIISEHEPTQTGLLDVMDAAETGDTILLPSATIDINDPVISGYHATYWLYVKPGVTMRGNGKSQSIINVTATVANADFAGANVWLLIVDGASPILSHISDFTFNVNITVSDNVDTIFSIQLDDATAKNVDVNIVVTGTVNDEVRGLNGDYYGGMDDTVAIRDCSVTIDAPDTDDQTGIQALNRSTYSTGLLFRDLYVKLNDCKQGSMGIYIESQSNSYIWYLSNSIVEIDQTYASTTHDTYGILALYTDVDSCQATVTNAGSENTFGLSAWEGGGFKNCIAYVKGAATSPDIVAGIQIYGYAANMYVSGCRTYAENTSTGNAYGIYIETWLELQLYHSSFYGETYDIYIDDGGYPVRIADCRFDTIYDASDDWSDIIYEAGDKASKQIITITSDTTLDATYSKVNVDATGGNVTVTLPLAVTYRWHEYHIKRIDGSANIVTIDANGAEVIDDQLTLILAQYDSAHIGTDGTKWWIY
jgi:hypothetical protein